MIYSHNHNKNLEFKNDATSSDNIAFFSYHHKKPKIAAYVPYGSRLVCTKYANESLTI